MIDRHCIFELHRLHHEGWSNRSIAEQLGIHRDTVGKYLKDPNPAPAKRKKKATKLDGFTEQIDRMLSEAPGVSAVVILQKLQESGFNGEISMLRKYLRKKRGALKNRQPFIRFESEPGHQMQVDWGHFGSLDYKGDQRKLYALVVIESYSRMMYVEFTHSQKQEPLHQCLFNAFRFFGGTPKELVVDNMATAVIERQGKVIRFNDRFLEFLRPFKISPRACNIRAAYEKGKVERAIGYLRKNFLPLRQFDSLADIQQQVLDWLATTANNRIHQTTGEAPAIRAGQVSLACLPADIEGHYPETGMVKVYKDFSIRFDANSYTAPPWCIGKQLTLKADQKEVRLYHRERLIAIHARCWQRKQRIENPRHLEEAKKRQHRALESAEENLFKSLGEEFREFLCRLAKSSQPLQKSLEKILNLKDQYGKGSLSWAIQKALQHNAIGADYIENILYQEMTPQTTHPRVRVKQESLNQIRLCEPNLAEYDAFIIKRR